MPELCFGTPAVMEALMQCHTGKTSHWAAVKGVYKKDMKEVCQGQRVQPAKFLFSH